jgi:sugar lactone lactonase YvrE
MGMKTILVPIDGSKGRFAALSGYLLSPNVPEGISIDAKGRVWICTDGEGRLRQLELKP